MTTKTKISIPDALKQVLAEVRSDGMPPVPDHWVDDADAPPPRPMPRSAAECQARIEQSFRDAVATWVDMDKLARYWEKTHPGQTLTRPTRADYIREYTAELPEHQRADAVSLWNDILDECERREDPVPLLGFPDP